jgi:hypothetical protein
MEYSLDNCITNIQDLIPQLANFVGQFNTFIMEQNVNVVSDSGGSLGIDVPHNMPEAQARSVTRRVEVLDSLIDSHRITIKELFRQGFEHEAVEKAKNSRYISVLTDKQITFNSLISSYGHCPK